jgi:hypothetical protein
MISIGPGSAAISGIEITDTKKRDIDVAAKITALE